MSGIEDLQSRRVRGEVHLATRIGEHYELVRELGAGQYAVTRLAIERGSGRRCVIKSLPLRSVDDAKVIELFEREASVLSRLEHPRIPRFIELVREETPEGTVLHIVQEFVEGETLAQAIARGARFTERDARRIALELLAIVEYLHTLSPPLIHRDIKPGNVIVGPSGEIWLVDFGGVRDKLMLDVAEEAHGFTIVGTYGYMPYEQFEGRALPASDLYAIGVTLIYLLSHKEPIDFERRGMKLDFAGAINVSPSLEYVIGRLVEPELGARYATAAEVRSDLERAVVPISKPRRRALLAIGGAAALVSALWFGWLAVGGRGDVTPPKPGTAVSKAGVPLVDRIVEPIEAWKKHSEDGSEPPLAMLPEPSGPLSVRGTVVYDGRPITELTRVSPQFWLRNETTGQVATASARYQHGIFTLHGLAPGTYGVNLRFDAVAGNRQGYPGDYYAFRTFDVPEAGVAEVAVDVMRLIHLVKPQDNEMVLDGWGEACDGRPSLAGPVEFAWEPIERGVDYSWSVVRVACPYQNQQPVASGITEETSIRLALEPTRAGEFYQFDLHARRDGKAVGMLMTYGSFGHGWDYRFVVASR